MKAKEFNKWETTRRMGKYKYVASYGMLRFGLPIGIISSFIREFFENDFALSNFITVEFVSELITRSLFYTLFAGLIFGFTNWYANEKKYKMHLAAMGNKRDYNSYP